LGAGLQMFHSGNIQRYLAAFALGLGLLLYGWLLPAKVLTPSPALAPHGALQQGARP
jgi:hypothetical protein